MRVAQVIRVDALWLAVEPLDMRAGTETALARVVSVFGAARPHPAYLFANRRTNRMKVLVHDGIGVWLAARRPEQRLAARWRNHRLAYSRPVRCAGAGRPCLVFTYTRSCSQQAHRPGASPGLRRRPSHLRVVGGAHAVRLCGGTGVQAPRSHASDHLDSTGIGQWGISVG